jgi:hypothetical protein
MSPDKIYYSPYPDAELPETSCWHFIFDNPNRPADDKVIYVDGLTDKEIEYVNHVLEIYILTACPLQVSEN